MKDILEIKNLFILYYDSFLILSILIFSFPYNLGIYF